MNWNPNDEETETQTEEQAEDQAEAQARQTDVDEQERTDESTEASSQSVSVNELTDELGRISFTQDVLHEIVHHAIKGIEGLGEVRDRGGGFVGIFGGRSKGIDVEMNDDGLRVRMNVTVSYGKPIHEVAREIQHEIKQELERMTGLDVQSVDIYVQNVKAHEEAEQAHSEAPDRLDEAESPDDERA